VRHHLPAPHARFLSPVSVRQSGMRMPLWVVMLATLVPALASCGGALPTPTMPAPADPRCGTVEARNGTAVDGAAALRTQACFWQAYQQCTVAGQQLAVRDVSAQGEGYTVTTTYLFTLDRTNGGCAITGQGGVQRLGHDATGTPFAAVGSYPIPAIPGGTCTGITRDMGGGLHLSGCFVNPSTYDVPRA